MSAAQATTQDNDSAAKDRRRKRKERAAKSRTPEPKAIVSGAGQPLDLSVRRELEEQLGHDFSRVRLHTDRDAGQLTEMLGADAVAVGQDIFFREGTYRPGTTDGRRLLAHELLHTVQNPHGLGALRAGRDLGAVSLPQEPIEREAEGAAQESVRGREPQPETAVEEGQATPGWLRYATVDADRNRMERIDPATLVDRLANSVVRSLRGDPEDRSKRTRMQLARLSEELQDAVLDRLETRLLSSEHERVLDLVDEIETDDNLEQNSLEAPAIEPDTAEELLFERDVDRRDAEERQEEQQKPPEASGPEKDQADTEGAPGSTPENESAPQQGGGQERAPSAGGGAPSGEQQPSSSEAQQPAGEKEAEGAKGDGKEGTESKGGKENKEGEREKGGKEGKEGTEQEDAPTASKEESEAKNRPGAVDSLVAGQQLKKEDKRGAEKPKGSPTMPGKDTQLPGRLSRLDGVRNQDLDPEEEVDEEPFGSGSESEVDVGGGEKSAWDIKLQPEDFLPTQDLDVSGVPTADKLDPSSSASPPIPSFPAPPVTKADKVQAERDAEDAEDAEAEPEEDADSLADTEPSVEAEEGGPGGTGLDDGLAAERAAEARPGPGTASRDPKSGTDPKAGPVVAQMTVQEAPGKSGAGSEAKESEAKEQAAKEEKGTPAAGDKSQGAPEKGSQQASGSKSTEQEPAAEGEQKAADSASAGKSEQSAESQSASPARDTQVTGGSNADTPGGASNEAASGAQSEPSAESSQTGQSTPAETPAPAAKESAPAAAQPTKAPEAPAATPGPKAAPKAVKAPKAAASKAAPAPKGQRGGGGGGGGGGKAAAPGKGKKKGSGPAPNLSQVAPEAGLSTASKLKPHVALEAMGGVGGAVDRTVGDEHQQLAASPPSMQRPAGAPQTLEGKPQADAPAQYSQDPAQKSEAPEKEKAEVTGAKEPEGQIEAEKAEEPGGWDTFKMALGFGVGKVLSWVGFEVDASELAAKFAGLPTKDEALKQAQAGNAPGVQMAGNAEQTAGEQGTAIDTKGQEAVTTARDDSGRAMGEDQVYPNAPKEQMAAKVPGQQGGKGGAPGGGAATGAVPPEAASEVAEHERGPQFQAAFSDGQKGMSEGRQTKDRDFRDSQAKHKQQVDAEIETNTQSQASERDKALSDVTAQREGWRKEQDEELNSLGTKKTERHEKVRTDVKDEEKKTDDNVTKEKETGDQKIRDENTKAEEQAEKKRDDSVEDSGNWISKAFDWIKKKVIEIKNAIVRVIREARDRVVGFIKNFKETVEGWINKAREAIVNAIKSFIEDLIEFAKAMVRAIIELANRIRKFITDLIDAAIALVNKLANMLKQIITDLLNAIGKLLSSILDVLKKMLQDVIKAVVDAVKAVLDFASKLLGALGDFMLIAVDFLSDPGGWLSGAKNSAVDGAKNHLFREVKSAVKAWFQSKIEEIIGVPKAIIDKLIKGGISLEMMVKETWEAIVPQLPFIIGEIVITKVIAKLIPGAGWVTAVIDAIRTAIGALGEILRAMGAVLDWLKAVRQGGAGILFAKAVAAGIVALLELAYEALLSGIGKYVAKVGRRLKGVAANLGKDKGGKPAAASPPAPGSPPGPTARKPQPQPPTQRPAPDPGKPGTRPTATKPGPGTKPTTKPGTKPDADKPSTRGPGKEEGPARPSPTTDAKRPTVNDNNGKPKDKEDDKPDTRPTPAAKPKPKPEPPAKPKIEPETKPKPKDGTPDKPKNGDQDSTKPKDDDKGPRKDKGQDPSKPKDQDPARPKGKEGADGDKPIKPKDGKGGGKSTKPKDNDDKDKDSKKGRDGDGKGGPRKPKDGERKNKDLAKEKQEKKDQRKEEEGQSKDDRLDEIVKRIRRILRKRLKPGIPRTAHLQLLAALRRHYRLTDLIKIGGPNPEIRAILNPVQHVTSYSEDGLNDYLVKHKLPRPDKNNFADGVDPKGFKRDFINPGWAQINGKPAPGKGQRQGIVGWSHIDDAELQDFRGAYFQWDAMHLLPRELGGPQEGANFIPAYSHINKPFYTDFESTAAKRFGIPFNGAEHVPGWYEVNLTLYGGAAPGMGYEGDKFPRGFPETMSAEWGVYKRVEGASGEEPAHWVVDERDSKKPVDKFDPPPSSRRPVPNINTCSRKEVTGLGWLPSEWVDAILYERAKSHFSDMDDVSARLRAYRVPGQGAGQGLADLDKYLKRMRNHSGKGRFTFQ
ncbi:DUF4157 domain-containing protein [Streptomyces sp. NPDC005962]|uniref:eCIS core domain-containing protein n=1 Tax=Streptomyces sp. NPDC005962 TaxID=3154466 RepID=UPI0033F24C58